MWIGDAESLTELKDMVDKVVDEGRLTNILEKFNRQADIDRWTGQAVDIITDFLETFDT